MSDNSFQVYRDKVFKLAFCIVVKSEYTANRTNERLLQFLEYETDPEKPETWKYYMNLAGEYHPTDKVMVVTSSDNLEEIEFNKTNLIRHRNTRRDYQFGTRQYGELLEKYPGQEDVILGILYPVDKATAIAARDHKILGYPDNLIESNEYTLVEKLQEWTDIYFKRYYNSQYEISDSLHYAVAWSMYGMNLFSAILSFRLEKHKSNEAHSYFVSEYLASNSNLGPYYKFMTLSQALHFYRNIRYYQRHPGQNETLDMLIDSLLTKRAMPVASYSMRHDISGQAENIYPEVMFKRSDMSSVPSAGAPQFTNMENFLAKEVPEAAGNEEEIAYAAPQITRFMKNSPSNVVQTKLLESSMIDYAGAKTYKLEDVQVAHWLYYASTGHYSAIVNVANPKTAERIVLTAKDAYVLAMYCMYKSFDVEPVLIPLMAAQRVQRYPLPTDNDIKSVVDMKYITDFTWTAANEFVREVEDMISIDAFYEKTQEITDSANYQRNLVSYQEGMHHRGETFKLITRYWQDAYVRLEEQGTTFQDWLFAHNLNFDLLNRADFDVLYASLVTAAIGKNLTTAPSLRNIQKAMASALKDLSSYTIQMVTKMTDEQTIMTDLPSVRIGEQVLDGTTHEYLRVGDQTAIKQRIDGVNLGYLPVNILSDVISHEVLGLTKHYLNIENGPHAPNRGTTYHHKFLMSRVETKVVNKPDVSGTNLPPVLGMNHFMTLTDEQKISLFV